MLAFRSATQAQQAERLLCWTLCYPFCSASQLSLALALAPARVYWLLTMLEERHMVEWVTPAAQGAGTQRLYHLSQEGVALLAQRAHAESAAALATRWGTREQDLLRLLPRLPTIFLVDSFLHGLVTFAPAMHTHAGRRAQVRWHWQRDYRHHFLYRQRTERWQADAGIIWRARPQEDEQAGGQERWFSAFVLVDSGLMPQALMRERLTAFFHDRESAARQSLPTVIILTTTWQRAELWRRAQLSAQAILGAADPLLGVITVTAPLAAAASERRFNPWLKLPWRTLATGVPCTLDQALRPLDQQALPPDLLAHLHDVQALQHHVHQSGTLFHQQPPSTSDEQPSRRRVVQGAFMARARHVAFMKSAASPAELLAFSSLIFGQRHLDLLFLLFQAPLLANDELAALTGLHPSSVLRYVRELRRFSCLHSWPDPADGEIRWSVAEHGLRLLAATHHLHVVRLSTVTTVTAATAAGHAPPSAEPAPQMALVPKGLELAKRQLNHTKGVYHFLVLLHQQLRVKHGRMEWWVLAGQCERSFHHSGRIDHVRPDAEWQLTLADGQQLRAWLEWDTGTMQQAGLTRKLQAYVRYARSRAWVREGLQSLPLLLFVVPEKSQEDKICRLLREVGVQAGLRARTTTQTRLDRAGGALAAIWRNPYQEGERSSLLPARG